MLAADESWSYAPSVIEIEDPLTALESEDLSNLSEENLRTLMKSFSETLRERKSHMNLLYNLKDCNNKDTLVEELQGGIQSLNHDIKCLASELEGRKVVKSKKCDEFIFPTISDTDDDTLDLTLLKQLIGSNFNGEDKLMFKSQYNALVHYSQTVPLNVRQLNQIFMLMLKGSALQYYTSLDPNLPIKTKIRNLLTVYSYRASIADRLRDLQSFERKAFEALDSVYLRLSAILDSTASLVAPASRIGRSEHILSHAMYTLALPAAKHRLSKFRSEKTLNGQFLTSRDLLRAAIRFEEGVTNNRQDPIPLCFRDPFINPGEGIREKKTAPAQSYDSLSLGEVEETENGIPSPQPAPQFWPSNTTIPKPDQSNEDLRRQIQDLSRQIDRLSKTYSEKASPSTEGTADAPVVETHGIDDESPRSRQQAPSQPEGRLGEFLESFLRAQYNFYKNFNYSSNPEQKNPSYLRFARWGSDYVRELSPDQQRSRYEDGRYRGTGTPQRPPPYRSYGLGRQPEAYQNPGRSYGTMPDNFRASERRGPGEMARRFPQTKRLRFSDFLQRQASDNSGGSSGAPSPQRNFLPERKVGRGSEQRINGGNQATFSQNNRGSKRPRENGNGGSSPPGVPSLEPSFSELSVSTPPETGFHPMPPKSVN